MVDRQAENLLSNVRLRKIKIHWVKFEFVFKVLQIEASKRLCTSEIKSHEFFNSIDWSQL